MGLDEGRAATGCEGLPNLVLPEVSRTFSFPNASLPFSLTAVVGGSDEKMVCL